jgi:hypothetical protein
MTLGVGGNPFGVKFWHNIFRKPWRRVEEPLQEQPHSEPPPTIEPKTLAPETLRPGPATAAELFDWTPLEEAVFSGDWLRLISTNVEAMRYDLTDLELQVEFKSRAVYRYEGVPPHVALSFYTTDSPGRFVWRRLRDKFPYERIELPYGERRAPTVLREITVGREKEISRGLEKERETIENWRRRWLKSGHTTASQPIYTEKMPGSV